VCDVFNHFSVSICFIKLSRNSLLLAAADASAAAGIVIHQRLHLGIGRLIVAIVCTFL
jgi:hypothetical protein